METYKPITHKFVAVLNKKIPVGVLLNALGHMSAGLSVSYSDIPAMRFDSYVDKDDNNHKSISDNPFIIWLVLLRSPTLTMCYRKS